MITNFLNLTRKLVVFDLETTGLKREECRIVEIGFQVFNATGIIKQWSSLVNPGIPIPFESTKTHGIVDEAVKDKPTFKAIGENLAKGFSNCDYAGKNIRFDLAVLSAEMKRNGVVWSFADACIIDADRLEQIGEPRDLSSLYSKHTGKRLDNAHSALIDVQATVEILAEQLKKYSILPRTVEALHRLQWPGWVDTEGKFKYNSNGVPCATFGKYRDQPMTEIPKNYWTWLLNSDFSTEIKNIAREAINGNFPENS